MGWVNRNEKKTNVTKARDFIFKNKFVHVQTHVHKRFEKKRKKAMSYFWLFTMEEGKKC